MTPRRHLASDIGVLVRASCRSKPPAGRRAILNPSRSLIKGVVCGVRVENVEEPTMRELRYLDKLVDELAKGKAMAKILRTP